VASFTSTVSDLTVSVNGSGSSDPDPGGSIQAYAWKFGDGTTKSGATASHTYTTPGTYPVELTVTDDRGATDTTTKEVAVTAPQFLARDLFNRTVTGGVGTADVGGPWTTVGGGSRLSVASGAAVFRHNAATNGNEAILSGVSSNSTDIRLTVTTDAAGTGGGTYVNIEGRRINGTTRYDGRLRWLSGNRWLASLVTYRGSTTAVTLASEVTVPGTFAIGTKVNVRLQVFGTPTTTIRMKAWAEGSPEPTTWLRAASDSFAALQASGSVGLVTYLSGSATTVPISARFDDMSVETVK
jgi:PKD repeat protein